MSIIDVVRAAPYDELIRTLVELGEAQGLAVARLATERQLEAARVENAEWVNTIEAARVAGLDVDSSARARLTTIKRVLRWSRGQKWCTRPKRGVVLVDVRSFRRWLELRRGARP